MKFIVQDPQSLLTQLEENEANLGKGMRWDELVLRIEWKCEMENLFKRNDISQEHKNEIREASENFKYCFNSETVTRWLKDQMCDF
jgi:hypothetical protein